MPSKHRIWNLIAGLALLVFTSAPLFAQQPPATVEVATVEQRLMSPVTWVPGTVMSRHDGWISAEIQGRLLSVVDVGDRVQKGALLAQVDDRLLQLERTNNQAEIDRLTAQLEFSEKQLSRLEELAVNNSASRTQLDNVLTQRKVLQQELVQAEVQYAVTQYNIKRSRVVAPFSGQVVERLLQQGEYALGGARLLRLVDVEEKEISANAPISVAGYLQDLSMIVVRSGDVLRELPLRAVIPVGDAVSRSLNMRISVSGNGNTSSDPGRPATIVDELLVGAAVRVAVPEAAPVEQIAVPRDAIHIRASGQQLVLVVEGIAQVVNTEVSVVDQNWVGVSGVNAGDLVVVRGGERLRSGQAVKIVGR